MGYVNKFKDQNGIEYDIHDSRIEIFEGTIESLTQEQKEKILSNTYQFLLFRNGDFLDMYKFEEEYFSPSVKKKSFTSIDSENKNIKELRFVKNGKKDTVLQINLIPIGGGGASEWGQITGNIQDQTDLQNELQDIREVAEGKTNTFSVDTDTTGNSGFKSDNEIITITSFVDVNGNTINVSELNVGDLVYTLNTQANKYKDRWLIDNALCTWGLIDADTPDLSGYATKAELNTAIGGVNDNIAPAYDNTVIYSIGDKVINENGELVTCLVNMTQAEEYDSTHWSQVSVASGFVDLDKEQVISGDKNHTGALQKDGVDVATTDQIDYVVLKDHTQFGALTGGEAYQMRYGGFVPAFASFNGSQRQNIFMQLTYISGTSYKATGWFMDSSRNMYIFEGQIGNVEENISTNVSYSNFVEVKLADMSNLITYAKAQGWIS